MRIYAVVEGACEERFLKVVVGEHLRTLGISLIPMKVRRGSGARGGGSSWQPWRQHISRLLKEQKSPEVRVTTMLDLYAIPKDTPGWTTPGSATGPQRANAMLQATAEDLSDWRFAPYIQVHEFETFLFVDLDELGRQAPDEMDPKAIAKIQEETKDLAPEEINDGLMTAPSKRITSCAPGFRKTIHGLQTVQSIGLPRLRAACPRFDAWLTRLEQLAYNDQP